MFKALVTLSLVSQAFAWLPGEHKQIFGRDGVDLFNRSSLHEAGLLDKRFLPSDYGNDKNAIRGVNLGSLFILENWMSSTVMGSWGCSTKSEFDCVSSLPSQDDANSKWAEHWQDWVSAEDFKRMKDYGLNTVRIPVGYWFLESIVDSSEHFPQGGEKYLDQVVGWAKDAGLYVIIVLHGAPGAQATDAFTGQYNPNPGFYSDYNYDRAGKWLEWMTEKIHQNEAYRGTVGMLELVNEPERTFDSKYPDAQQNTESMNKNYYPDAWSRIRKKEDSLNVAANDRVHIQMMNEKWGSGDPKKYLTDLNFAAYDDHHYIKYVGLPTEKAAYLKEACTTDRSGNTPVFVGEWSLSVDSSVENTDDWKPDNDITFYKKFWAGQVMSYEKTAGGWIFWSWKTTGLNDPRWDYQMAVDKGIIDRNPDAAYNAGAC